MREVFPERAVPERWSCTITCSSVPTSLSSNALLSTLVSLLFSGSVGQLSYTAVQAGIFTLAVVNEYALQ